MVPVVSGQGVPGAGKYDPNKPGPHPVVILTTSGTAYNDWNERLPPGWSPSSVSETELVILIGPEQEVDLYPPGFFRKASAISYKVDVELREARTGKTLEATTFTGTDPRPYPYKSTNDTPSGTEVPLPEGSHFEYAVLEDWLCPNEIIQGCWMPLRALAGHNEGETSEILFSPDGETKAVASSDKNNVELLQVSDNSLLRILRGGGGNVYSLAFSPDGQSLATGMYNGTVHLWRISDGSLMHTLGVSPPDWSLTSVDSIYSVAISPDGQMLAMVSGWDTVSLWKVSNGTQLPLETGSIVGGLAFSPDGQILAGGTRSGDVRLWRVSDGTVLRDLLVDFPLLNQYELAHYSVKVASLAFSPDGQILAAGLTNHSGYVWRVTDGSVLRTMYWPGIPRELVFSPDGQTLASGASDGSVHLWKVK